MPAPAPADTQSPVVALLSQAKALQSGLGASKPPKKKARREATSNDNSDKPNEPKKSAKKPSSEEPNKPQALKCKKKSGTCKHEIVFGEHYDCKAWNAYADHVRSKKSSVVIDPDYLA